MQQWEGQVMWRPPAAAVGAGQAAGCLRGVRLVEHHALKLHRGGMEHGRIREENKAGVATGAPQALFFESEFDASLPPPPC